MILIGNILWFLLGGLALWPIVRTVVAAARQAYAREELSRMRGER